MLARALGQCLFMLPALRKACGANLDQTQRQETVSRSNKQNKKADMPSGSTGQKAMPLRLLVATWSSSTISTCANMSKAANQSDQPFENDKLWLQALRKHLFLASCYGAAAVVAHSWTCICIYARLCPALVFCAAFSGLLCYVQARQARSNAHRAAASSITVLEPGALESEGRRRSGSPCPSSPVTWPHRPQPCN